MAATAVIGGERIDYAAILPQRTKLIILAGVMLSLFLAALDQTIVATALPAIIRDFNGIGLIGWISTGYLLASTAMVPIYGKLSDIYGRKIILVWGIVVFLLGSALCGIAGSMIQLVIYRVVQGVGAAALTSTAFAVPADLFTPAERPRFTGIIAAVFGLASVIGPFLGGLLTDRFSWHWVFYVNVPIGLVALAFVLLKMPKLASGLRAPIDWLGSGLLLLAVVPLLLGLTLDKTAHPWGSPLILGLFALAALGTVLFLLQERRAAAPIIALNLFGIRTYAVAIVASMLNGAAFFGAVLFVSLFLVNVIGVSATSAGSAQIPLMMAFVVSSIGASQLVQRTGRYKLLILAGFTVMLIGFVLLYQIDVNTTAWDITWRMLILGFGLGPALPLLNLALQNAVPPSQIGAATASRQFFQQLGQAIGAAVFGVILATTLAAQLSANLAPVLAEAPPELRAAVDLRQIAGSGLSTEGASDQSDIGAQLVAATNASFAQQRAQLTAAKPGDQAALAQLDTAQAQAVGEAQTLGGQIKQAVRAAYASSITGIYFYTIWLVVIALVLVTLGLQEQPLRKTNASETHAPAFE